MNNTIKQTNIDMIRRLSSARGASGFEDEVVAEIRSLCGNRYDIKETTLRNIYLGRKANTGGKPMMMLDAHSDEVGFMVQSIRPNGTLTYLELGVFSANSLVGHRVWVRNTLGEYIPGIVACKPTHFSGGKSEDSELVIDIGACSAEEATQKFHIGIGEPGVPAMDFLYDEKNDLIFAKALDCRIGCAALLTVMDRLAEENLHVDLTGVLSSQEELGDRSVRTAARTIKPDIAIVFEGAPADDTFPTPHGIQTGLKRGPMLRYMDRSMITHPRFIRFALETAKQAGIAVQTAVRAGGGNNGGAIHLSENGIPSIVLSVPVRYIHSCDGIASYSDFEAAVELAVALIKAMNSDVLAGF